nr:protein ODORANT1-like [Malus domestica]
MDNVLQAELGTEPIMLRDTDQSTTYSDRSPIIPGTISTDDRSDMPSELPISMSDELPSNDRLPAADMSNELPNDGAESMLFDSICNDNLLTNTLWMDETPLIDALWNDNNQVELDQGGINYNITENNGMGFQSNWDDNWTWLLDCQDYGIHDFGMDCFSNVEVNGINTLEVGEKLSTTIN